MHLYARTIGLSEISTKSAMDILINKIIDGAVQNNCIIYNHNTTPQGDMFEAQINYSMLRKQIGFNFEDMGGLCIRGMYNPKERLFEQSYYFPYIKGENPRFNKQLAIERQTDKEAYLVHCDEPRREVSPIFFLKNIVDYLSHGQGENLIYDKFVYLSALSTGGRIIFPIRQTKAQIEKCNADTNKRNMLVDMALRGDIQAIDDLTLSDYDLLSNICERIKKEDVYSIVNSSFIPSGLECDCYSVVGNILEIGVYRNEVTTEEVYNMLLECNDNIISVGINKKDLLGMPQAGCRFVGKIWLQGYIDFQEKYSEH